MQNYSQSSLATCINVATCSSFQCRPAAGEFCLNASTTEQRLPTYFGLHESALVQLDLLSLTMTKFLALPTTSAFCFSVAERRVFFVGNQNHSILVSDFSQLGTRLYTLWSTNGTITNLACDWLCRRVFLAEFNLGKLDVLTRSFVRVAGLQNGNELVAHLQQGTTITDFKFHTSRK